MPWAKAYLGSKDLLGRERPSKTRLPVLLCPFSEVPGNTDSPRKCLMAALPALISEFPGLILVFLGPRSRRTSSLKRPRASPWHGAGIHIKAQSETAAFFSHPPCPPSPKAGDPFLAQLAGCVSWCPPTNVHFRAFLPLLQMHTEPLKEHPLAHFPPEMAVTRERRGAHCHRT